MIFSSIRRKLKIFSILFSFILLLPTRTSLYACAYGPESEELRYMIFNPDLTNQKMWWTYFYNARLHYLDGSVTSNEDEKFLADEWTHYIKADAGTEEAIACLFQSLSDSALHENTFYKALIENEKAKEYYELARQCEQVSAVPSPWEDDPQAEQKRTDKRFSLIQTISGQLQSEKDTFIQRKLAFQLLKLSYYQENRLVANDTYNKFFKGKRDHVLDWWAMHYKSMILERENKTDSANYFHALVFSNSSNKMFASRQWFSRENIDQILALAPTDKDSASVLILAETINPGRSLTNIQKIYQLDPSHKHLPLLLSREINKLEDWLGTPLYAKTNATTRGWDKSIDENVNSDMAYLDEVQQAFEKMKTIQQSNPVFFSLSLAYLSIMNRQYNAASEYLDQTTEAKPDVTFQKNILRILLTSESQDLSSVDTQNKIGFLLDKLIQARATQFESQKMLYSLCSYLRTAFERKGMLAIAGLFDNYAVNKFCYTCEFSTFEYSLVRYYDRMASASDIEKLIALYDKSDKNKLEQILFRPYANKNFFYDVLSVKYLREGNVKKALQAVQQIPDEFWFSYGNALANLDKDPFLENNELLSPPGFGAYTRHDILEKLAKLENDAINNPDKKADAYFQLGNAWYNFTQHSWFMISYGFSVGTTSNPKDSERAIERAMGYYKKALALEENPERRSQLLYMVTLLSPSRDKTRYAGQYEELKQTKFYLRKNCLTTREIAQ